MTTSREARRLLLQRRLKDPQIDARGLREAAAFYAALIAQLIETQPEIELPALSEPTLTDKLQRGEPMLFGESLGFDGDAIRRLLAELCTITEQFSQPATTIPTKNSHLPWGKSSPTALRERIMPSDASDARAASAAQIRRALASGDLNFDALLDALMLGHDDDLSIMAAQAHLDANLLNTLARFAFRPTMLAFADALANEVRAHEELWQHGMCPLCGGAPLLSEYRDQDQSRHLRCGACGTSWLFRRLQCSHCGSDQFRLLSYIQLDGDQSQRVDACGNCRHYLKGISASDPMPSDLLPLEDLLTLHLDVAAQQQGFARM